MVYSIGDYCQEMHIIQSGKVEVLTYLNKKKFEFVIENLARGCIINQNSFLMNDELDTDARCATNVSLYTMEIEVLNALRLKHQELDLALEQ